MPRISFQQGVALAMGAYIDPANPTNNRRFTLVGESGSASYNVNGVFAINPRTGRVDNRLSALFHGRLANLTDVGFLDFAANTAGPALGNLGNEDFIPATTTSTSIADSELTGYDVVFIGYNAAHKQLDYRIGGDINDNASVSKVERNYHRTGLAIWNKLKK